MTFPSLAYLYAGTPFILIAEYVGGICFCTPTNELKVSTTSDLETFFKEVSITSPSASSVFVLWPNFITASYDLSSFKNNFDSFVPLLSPMIKSPLASGSNVPKCPAFFIANLCFTFWRVWFDEGPLGLFIKMIPSLILNLASLQYD